MKKKIKIVISFKSTRLRVDINDFDLLNPKMKLFLRSVLYFGFYWVEKFDALKKRSKEAAVAQIRRTNIQHV